MKVKVPLFSKKIWRQYAAIVAVLSAISSFYFIAIEVPTNKRQGYILVATVVLVLLYILIWVWANLKRRVKLNINNSSLVIKVGDIFEEQGLKAIAFNEYFDTTVDDKLISKSSLHGKYILKNYPNNTEQLDRRITDDTHLSDHIVETNSNRRLGKQTKYKLGSIFLDGEFMLTAFSHFDSHNRAFLSLKDYVNCLVNFWDEVDQLYAGRSVALPLLGSGITRFKDTDVQPQELLNIIIWTFKISRIKFRHPANATIVIHESLADKINLYNLDA